MKLKWAFIAGLLASAATVSAQSDPVIMTIGGEPVLKSEFEYIYNKNSSSSIDKKSLDEYVDLFVKFKMKVMEAKERQLNELPSYLKEYQSYKDQLILPYLIDNETEENLAREAYERYKTMVNCSHILIKVKDTDSLSAYKKINDLYAQLKKGADFAELAKKNSECPSAAQGGMLNYIKPFTTVYPFETAAYNTPVGQYSRPFRTEFGYHIVKVHSVLNVENSYRVAQIFKRESPTAKASADSIRQAIKSVEDFNRLVLSCTDDRDGAMRGGELGWVNAGRFPAELEAAARKMTKVGEVSDVIKTEFGYHILVARDIQPMESYEKMLPELKKRLLRDSRSMTVVQKSREKLEMKYAFSKIDGGLDPFYAVAQDTTLTYSELNGRLQDLDAPLFTISGEYYPQASFVSAFKNHRDIWMSVKDATKKNTNDAKRTIERNKEYLGLTPHKLVDLAFDKYINEVLTGLYKETLLQENKELRNLLQEYSDGLLLFDISSKEVWSKATSNVDGLTKFFEANKEKYRFDSPRFKGVVVRCVDKNTKSEVEKFAKDLIFEGMDARILTEFNKNGVRVKAESGLYAKGANKVVDQEYFNVKGAYSDAEYPYVVCIGELLEVPNSFKDVKGPVTADYQNYLEEEWVKHLRSKYNVKLNQDVLKTVKSNN